MNLLEEGKMLIIGREVGQSVIIGDEIKVTVLQKGSKFQLAIDAPKHIQIIRVKQSPNNMENLKKQARIIGETVQIGELIKVSILQTESGLIRFAIVAPKEITVFREEIYYKKNSSTKPLNYQKFKILEFYQPNYT
jgi:carbon storage regulator CsrA